MLQEFKPALSFLVKFLGIYFVGNLLYGLYVESYQQQPDRLTQIVTEQTVTVLNWLGNELHTESSTTEPKVYLKSAADTILNVFEGCNGINVMVIFVAFIFAYDGAKAKIAWFIPAGILVIHLFNLLRIALLFYVAQYYQSYFYYIHKYFFTAALYLIVFMLWAIWVFKLNAIRKTTDA